jgi:RNA polymerase sigma-70 factor (ECF subfamily)
VGGDLFPSTIWSEILAAADSGNAERGDRLDALCRRYWKPVYAFVCAAWPRRRGEAADLTQAFFAYFLEKRVVERMDPERGSFRRYLKRALRSFLIDAQRHDAVRRPAAPLIPLGEVPEVPAGSSPEEAYDRTWVEDLVASALEHLRLELAGEDRSSYWELFRAHYDPPESPGYRQLAEKFGLETGDVRVRLEFCRRILRRYLRERIREYVATDTDVEQELKELGI